MGITISDIKKAILGGGDVSPFIPALRRAVGDLPVTSVPSLELPTVLPEATTILRYFEHDLAPLLDAWLAGKGYKGSLVPEIDLTLVGLAPYGQNISSYLERIISEVKPDIVAIDTSPAILSANMLYAFSMPCAVGVPVYSDVLRKDDGQFYTDETFYPGNMSQTAIIKCWLAHIPLIPVGMPLAPKRRGRESTPSKFLMDKEIQKSNLFAAYQTLDESLKKTPDLQKGIEIVQGICSRLSRSPDFQVSRAQLEEARYISSRIMEAASFVSDLGKQAKFLAIVDVKYYDNTQYVIDLLKKGITEEVYLTPRGDVPAGTLAMVSKYSAKINEYAQQHAPKTTLLQELFGREFEKLSAAKSKEPLPESEVDNLIAAIVSRTRAHPDVARGASVRGAIAFKEVLQGFREIQGGLTVSSIEKAALVTLPPRIYTRRGDHESASAIVRDIVKEVLYGIRFFKEKAEMMLPDKMDWLSPEDLMTALQNLNPAQLSQEQMHQLAEKGQMVVIPDKDSHQELPEYLTSKDFLHEGSVKPYSFTEKDIEHLLEELEQKRRRGEITEDEYIREKTKLEEMLSAATQLQSQMSGEELAETVLEFMDAKDKQWGKEVSLERMYIYYHIKGTCEGKQLSSPKQGYLGLRVLLDGLEKRGILRGATTEKGFILTAEALNTLLEQVTVKAWRGWDLKGVIDSGRTQFSERNHDIRRYTLGDVFRDISVRHTLREIAKQKKSLSDIDRRDFKVFMKQHRELPSDIVLCVDSSGSMGFHQKLIYARLVAAGLAKAAAENGDRVGVVTFDDFGRIVLPLTSQKEEVFNFLASIDAGGNTNIGDGIKCATELLLGEPSRNQKYIVLVTDGQPTAISERAFNKFEPTEEKDLTAEYAILETRKASSGGVKTSVIHIANGEASARELVKNIAMVGKGQVRRISSPEDMMVIRH